MTALIPQTKTSALDGVADLGSALKSLVSDKPAAVAEKASKTPKVVPVSEETREAISRLSGLLRTTELPSERRRLTDTELARLEALGADAKLVEKGVKLAVESVKTAVFNHFDVGLEESNSKRELSKIARDARGHYLVKGEQEVPESGKKFVRQLSEGSPDITAADLLALQEAGKITRKQYLAVTRVPEVPRVLDEDALLNAIKADPELLEAIKPAIKPGKVIASFWIRNIED